jgi:hypothetical protein
MTGMSAEYFRSPVFAIRWPRPLVGAELDRLLELPGKRQPGSGAGYGAYWDQQVERFFQEAFAGPEAAEEWKRSRTDGWNPWGASEIPSQPDTSWLQLMREHLEDLPEPQARVPYWSLRQRTAGVTAQEPALLGLAGAAGRIAQVVAELEETGYLAWAFGQTCVDGDEEGALGHDPAAAVHQALGRQGLWPIDTGHAQYTAGDLFDVVEFLADHVRRPTRAWPHTSFDCGWHYLDFDAVRGLQIYRWRINEVLHASDLHATLGETGRLERSAPAGVEALARAVHAVPAVHTADTDELHHALRRARYAFCRQALEQ